MPQGHPGICVDTVGRAGTAAPGARDRSL